MKEVRRVGDLGMIVIPKQVREKLGIMIGEELEIYARRGRVVIKRKKGAKKCENWSRF